MSPPVIVLGAGPNGLAAAATLARAGRGVSVLEARDAVGGLAAAEELHPGFPTAGLHHDSTGVRPGLVDALDLTRHGLRWRARGPSTLAAHPQGRPLWLHADDAATADGLAAHDAADAEAWPRWNGAVARLSGVLGELLDAPPPDLAPGSLSGIFEVLKTGLSLRRLGPEDMSALLRIGPMCVADWMAEWFSGERLRGALCVPAVAGTWLGPWSAGSALNLLVQRSLRGPGVEGDGPALVAALEASARAAGAEVRTGATVEEILVDADGVRGVRLPGGEVLATRALVTTCDPRAVFTRLLGPRSAPPRLRRRLSHWRVRGTSAFLRLALSEAPAFPGVDETVEHAVLGAHHPDLVEQAFDPVKYDALPERPVLDVRVTPAARGAVASVHVLFATHALEGGWTDGARQTLTERVLDTFEVHAPGLRERIVAHELLTPVDLEQRYHITGGHLHHGEHALDQLLVSRPDPECARYVTPVPGLVLAGSGSHPGGGLSGMPGWLGAKALLGAS